jgi:hypothetical protein
MELERKIEGSVLMRDEGVEDIRDKVYRWRMFGIIMGKCKTKL